MLARLTAYTKAAALWRARHQHWRTVNSKRKAQLKRRAAREEAERVRQLQLVPLGTLQDQARAQLEGGRSDR